MPSPQPLSGASYWPVEDWEYEDPGQDGFENYYSEDAYNGYESPPPSLSMGRGSALPLRSVSPMPAQLNFRNVTPDSYRQFRHGRSHTIRQLAANRIAMPSAQPPPGDSYWPVDDGEYEEPGQDGFQNYYSQDAYTGDESPPEPIASPILAAAANYSASGNRKRKQGATLESAGDSGTVRDEELIRREMLSAAKRLYGRYFDISDSNADILVHRFYLDFAPGVPIREAARKRILELKRNWQRKIIRAIRDHVQSEVLRQPNLLHWSEDKVEAHFHSAYDLEAMETKILKPISKVVDVKAIFRGKLASLYVAWYIHVCRLILKEIAPYLRSNDPDMRKRIRGHRHTEEVYHAFRTIALQNTYEEVRVEDVPIKAPRGNGGERNNRIKTA